MTDHLSRTTDLEAGARDVRSAVLANDKNCRPLAQHCVPGVLGYCPPPLPPLPPPWTPPPPHAFHHPFPHPFPFHPAYLYPPPPPFWSASPYPPPYPYPPAGPFFHPASIAAGRAPPMPLLPPFHHHPAPTAAGNEAPGLRQQRTELSTVRAKESWRLDAAPWEPPLPPNVAVLAAAGGDGWGTAWGGKGPDGLGAADPSPCVAGVGRRPSDASSSVSSSVSWWAGTAPAAAGDPCALSPSQSSSSTAAPSRDASSRSLIPAAGADTLVVVGGGGGPRSSSGTSTIAFFTRSGQELELVPTAVNASKAVIAVETRTSASFETWPLQSQPPPPPLPLPSSSATSIPGRFVR
jgi:hypothetical protein